MIRDDYMNNLVEKLNKTYPNYVIHISFKTMVEIQPCELLSASEYSNFITNTIELLGSNWRLCGFSNGSENIFCKYIFKSDNIKTDVRNFALKKLIEY